MPIKSDIDIPDEITCPIAHTDEIIQDPVYLVEEGDNVFELHAFERKNAEKLLQTGQPNPLTRKKIIGVVAAEAIRIKIDDFYEKHNLLTLEQFFRAIKDGDVETLKTKDYLEYYFTYKNFEDKTPFELALSVREEKVIELVQTLLQNTEGEVNKNVKLFYGKTPLHLVIENPTLSAANKLELVKFLLKENADVLRIQDEAGETPLYKAIILDGDSEIVDCLFQYKEEVKKALFALSIKGHRLLGEVIKKFTKMVEENKKLEENKSARIMRLIEADLNSLMWQDTNNETAFHVIVAAGQYILLNELLQKYPKYHFVLHFKNNNDRTVLEELLIKADANENTSELNQVLGNINVYTLNSDDENNMLHLAAAHNLMSIIGFLYNFLSGEKHIKIDLDMKNEAGFTPLHLAAINGHLEMFEYLLRQGADVSIRNNAGDTLLHLLLYSYSKLMENKEELNNAVKEKYIRIIKDILEQDSAMGLIRTNNSGHSASFLAFPYPELSKLFTEIEKAVFNAPAKLVHLEEEIIKLKQLIGNDNSEKSSVGDKIGQLSPAKLVGQYSVTNATNTNVIETDTKTIGNGNSPGS